MPYQITISAEALHKAHHYLEVLRRGNTSMGSRFAKIMKGTPLNEITLERFIEHLIQAKKPRAFNEGSNDAKAFNSHEMAILGDVGINVDVTIYDNGQWINPTVYNTPIDGHLLFVPGAVLEKTSPDFFELGLKNAGSADGFSLDAFIAFYKRRLLPQLFQANEIAKERGKPAYITMPGLGCGAFAGPFKGKDEIRLFLDRAVRETLTQFESSVGEDLHIKGVLLDLFEQVESARLDENAKHYSPSKIHYKTITSGGKVSQLVLPKGYEDCELFSIVAADAISWPGNDFYVGSRWTDEGAKGAATNVCAVMTEASVGHHVPGAYQGNGYVPANGQTTWEHEIGDNRLKVKELIYVIHTDGKKLKKIRLDDSVHLLGLGPRSSEPQVTFPLPQVDNIKSDKVSISSKTADALTKNKTTPSYQASNNVFIRFANWLVSLVIFMFKTVMSSLTFTSDKRKKVDNAFKHNDKADAVSSEVPRRVQSSGIIEQPLDLPSNSALQLSDDRRELLELQDSPSI